MIVTCCVSLLVMLSMPQMRGKARGTAFERNPLEKTWSVFGFDGVRVRSEVTSMLPNDIAVPGIFVIEIGRKGTGVESRLTGTAAVNGGLLPYGSSPIDQRRSVMR